MSFEDECDDTLRYSSDADFTPSILSSFSFSPSQERRLDDVQNGTLLTTEIIAKLDFISNQISGVQEMLQTVIAKNEQMEIIRTSAVNGVGGYEGERARLPRDLDDRYCKTHLRRLEYRSDEDSVFKDKEMENDPSLSKVNFDGKAADYSWVSRIYVDFVAYFQWIIQMFTCTQNQNKVNAETLKVLKVPDDVKIAIELRKARVGSATFST